MGLSEWLLTYHCWNCHVLRGGSLWSRSVPHCPPQCGAPPRPARRSTYRQHHCWVLLFRAFSNQFFNSSLSTHPIWLSDLGHRDALEIGFGLGLKKWTETLLGNLGVKIWKGREITARREWEEETPERAGGRGHGKCALPPDSPLSSLALERGVTGHISSSCRRSHTELVKLEGSEA